LVGGETTGFLCYKKATTGTNPLITLEETEKRRRKMTEKAKKILNDLKRRDRKLFRRPETRERVLHDFNESTLDQPAQVGSQDQQMRVLNEMNELGQQEEQSMRKSLQGIHLL
jgi:hypothetical protein